MVEIRLLGPVEVVAGGARLDAGPPRQRSVLAAIAADAGRPVPMTTVIERVWGPDAPPQARRTLYVYIARLRSMISAAGGPTQLVSRSNGYELAAGTVDVLQFRALLAQARSPGITDSRRATLLAGALGLWRGVPLADLTGDWATQVAAAWQQQHVDAAVEWGRAELRLGNASAVIGPLTELAVEHPLVESLAEVLIRALHVVGRKADALARFSAVRERLAGDLGVDPGPALRDLQRAILRDEARSPVPVHPPAQLPADLRAFAGRQAALAALDAMVAAGAAVAAISGTAGVGKTSLAVHWAHQMRSRFPDGQLHVNLHGFGPGPATAPASALHGFLEALGVPAQRIPAELPARAALYRSVLDGRRMLIVLDNARDADQVRPLLPGGPGPVVLVTSRDQLLDLIATDDAHPVALPVMTADEARELMRGRLGRSRVDAEPEAVDRIIASCARLPLALATVAARAATNPTFPLTALVEDAASLSAVFAWSYRTLTPPAARRDNRASG